MEFDLEVIRTIALGVVGLLFWFLKRTIVEVQTELKEVKHDINNIKIEYVHKQEFKEFKNDITKMFDMIRADIKELGRRE